MTELSPGPALVLACARVAPDPDALSRIAVLASAVGDWNNTARLGIRHGLGPLMYRNLAAARVEPPRAAAAALWARAQWAARRGHDMSAELRRIAAALRASAIRFVSFKGPLLAERVHGDCGLRESGDLDIVVPANQVRRARECMQSLGYCLPAAFRETHERLSLHSPGRHELTLTRPGQAFIVELQWRANPELDVPAVSDETWWARARNVEIDGEEWTAIPPEEELLALLVHGTKHAWGSLDWLVDIGEIARRGEVPWPAFVQLARRHHAVRRAALGLLLARRLLGTPLPLIVDDLIEAADVGGVADWITPRLLDPEFRAYGIGEALQLQLAVHDTLLKRVACVAAAVRPTPGDWEWMRLPAGLAWLYWPLRPVRLAAKYLFRAPRPQNPAGATPRTPPPRPHSTS